MKRQIILASTSPRRKQLLEQIGLNFDIAPSDYEEDMSLPMPPSDLVQYLALGKATAVADNNPDAIVIGADSIVVYEDKIFGKPKSKAEAKQTLQLLRGHTHTVMTGVAILYRATDYVYQTVSLTEITMRDFSDQEIDDYIATGEPLDKAGSYALQERGAIFITKINGDHSGAIGLPLSPVWIALQEALAL